MTTIHYLYKGLLACLLITIVFFAKATENTPYPETIELNQIVSAEKEASRLRQIQTKFDNQPTGFYIPVGEKILIKVENIVAAQDNQLPRIVIGTPRRAGNTVKEINLTTGENLIDATSHQGGMIFFRYVSTTNQPTGKVRISFLSGSKHVRVPYFVKGVTTDAEFSSMMTQYQTQDVMFSTNDAVIVVSREAALKYSTNNDKDAWLAAIDKILLAEDQISGLSNSDPNPLHHRLAQGIRHLFTEAGSGYMFATNQVTGYCGDAAINRLLSQNMIENNNWGVAHELGHQHQQGAYKPGNFTETTVNIYTLAVQRAFQGDGYIRSSEETWNKLKTDYFALPLSQRNFHDETLKPITGDINSSRLLLFDQLQIIFGDEFYHRLHRITREEEVSGGSDEERSAYFVLKSCQLTGYDLRDFFKEWGFLLSSYYQGVVDKAVVAAELKKASCNDQLHLVSPYFKPSCLPLPLIGISSSKPDTENRPNDSAASISKYCNYSTKTGIITDSRDNKQYSFKRYGEYDWFMENLDWDGYDGINETSKGIVGLYGSDDPDGQLYGRMYPTNATASTYNNWCPEGWSTPTNSQWEQLLIDISNNYRLSSAEIANCLKCGGDQDEQADGLWSKGAGTIGETKAAEVGFNVLPSGVFNKDANTYDSGDKVGQKASFFIPSSTWYHQVLTSGNNSVVYINRNTRHHASIRCVRKSLSTSSDKRPSIQTSYRVFFSHTDDLLHIQGQEPVLGVNIYDITGRCMDKSIPPTIGHARMSIGCQQWGNGVYIVTLKNKEGFETYKTVKY